MKIMTKIFPDSMIIIAVSITAATMVHASTPEEKAKAFARLKEMHEERRTICDQTKAYVALGKADEKTLRELISNCPDMEKNEAFFLFYKQYEAKDPFLAYKMAEQADADIQVEEIERLRKPLLQKIKIFLKFEVVDLNGKGQELAREEVPEIFTDLEKLVQSYGGEVTKQLFQASYVIIARYRVFTRPSESRGWQFLTGSGGGCTQDLKMYRVTTTDGREVLKVYSVEYEQVVCSDNTRWDHLVGQLRNLSKKH